MNPGREIAKQGVGDAAKAPAVVAAITRPGLVVFERHRGELSLGYEYDEYDDSGKLVARCWPPERVDKYTKLVPEDACRALIAELDAALSPALYDQAKALARTVMGRYAKRDLYDPDIFVFEMTRVFGEAPADLGREASDRLRAKVFLANVGDVKGVLDGLVRERKDALAQVKRHLDEHERRRAAAAEPEPDRVTPEQVSAILEKSGGRKDLDEAEARAKAERPVPEWSRRMRERANAAAMETVGRQRAEASGG